MLQLHATCLGFEAVAVIASGNASILSRFDAEDYPQALLPTEKAEHRCNLPAHECNLPASTPL